MYNRLPLETLHLSGVKKITLYSETERYKEFIAGKITNETHFFHYYFLSPKSRNLQYPAVHVSPSYPTPNLSFHGPRCITEIEIVNSFSSIR